MPWFPEFVSAAELARRDEHAQGAADPVAQYLAALDTGDSRGLERVWPGDVLIQDPRAGVVRGHAQVRDFVRRNMSWLASHHAHVETVATTTSGSRAVVELLARVDGPDGRTVEWPVAVVAESADERSVTFRTYCSQWPVDGRRHVRPPVLGPSPAVLPGVTGRYRTALETGDVGAVLGLFHPAAYLRESFGPHSTHRGPAELRAYFTACFDTGGIELEPCSLTEQGRRSAVEYTCVRWGSRDLPPQAGLAVHERGTDDLLTAVRLYDDIEPPARIGSGHNP